MVTVNVENGNLEKALRKFRREVEKEGIMQVVKDKQYFVKPSAKKHEKKKYAQHRAELARKAAKNERKDEDETR